MSTKLPSHFFRIRENGAAVFRVDTENRHQRIEMDQIATVNTKNGDIKVQNGRELNAEDQKAIDDWLSKRIDRKSVV